ncbi:hypothetical protein SAMN05444172_7493 [Burkholderia sp. GAS332]|nr:hypothetical protein SAMN05444172_7493 [Burkholderia sp. GAS332]
MVPDDAAETWLDADPGASLRNMGRMMGTVRFSSAEVKPGGPSRSTVGVGCLPPERIARAPSGYLRRCDSFGFFQVERAAKLGGRRGIRTSLVLWLGTNPCAAPDGMRVCASRRRFLRIRRSVLTAAGTFTCRRLSTARRTRALGMLWSGTSMSYCSRFAPRSRKPKKWWHIRSSALSVFRSTVDKLVG